MQGRTFYLLIIAGFASSASVRIGDPLVPALAAAFDVSTIYAAQTITVFAFAYGVMQLIYGPIGDRLGKLRIITLACLASTLGSTGAALAPSLEWLILFRLLSGATAAALIPLSVALIGDLVPYDRRQPVIARYLSGVILGLVSGHFLGGLLSDLISWRASFAFLALVFAVAGLLLRRGGDPEGAPPAPAATKRRDGPLAGYGRVLRIGWARVIVLMGFLEGAMVFGVLAFVPAYLHTRFGLSLTAAGSILALFGLGGLAYTIIVPRIIGRLGEQGLILCGGLLLGSAFGGLLLAGGIWQWALPAMFFAGLGFYMLHNTLQTHATQMAPAARGTAVSMFAASMFIGNSAGVAGAAALIEVADIGWVFAIISVGLPLLCLGFHQALRIKKGADLVSAEKETG